jgi:photosystem II stability/assembly factor-like uncharacterized protein
MFDRRNTRWFLLMFLLFALLIAPGIAAKKKAAKSETNANEIMDPHYFQSMEYRLVGPHRGGRSTAVAGVIQDRNTFYFGGSGGGLWKTTDGGQSWLPIADGEIKAGSIGAIAVAPSDPNVVYVGTGSACPRGNVSAGVGTYRSTDGGGTWQSIGLENSGQIGSIKVHPTDPDLLYVAALGNIFGPNEERGVYRSRDGGNNWEKILYASERAGAVDLSIDPNNPRVIFAGFWEVERNPWTLISGGEGSGLWVTRDGGDNWEKVTEGLPEGTWGKVAVSVSGATSQRVYALIEAEKGGLFRSDDGGKKWRMINDDSNFRQRAWYYTHLFADPKNADKLYILNVGMWGSNDGGKSFRRIRTQHGDNHDLWIHPEDPNIMIEGNDGGANVSYNGGRSWSVESNQPTAEFYRVSVDDRFPYRIYGCQQDNSCVSIASRTGGGGIGEKDWYIIGGCESGHVAIDPRDPNITYSGCYGGSLGRYDHKTGQHREIMAWPQVAVGMAARDLKYRWQWNAPIRLSPHDPDTLYHASQVVHRSKDQGQSWEEISPDLSRNDPEKQDYAGAPITRDNTGVEVYSTIFAFEESPQTPGTLWAGTDDGLVHISRDDGKNWTDITPKKMPEWGTVNTIDLSAHQDGRALIAVQKYRLNDFAPYIFRTNDFGATWTKLTDGDNGIPDGHFVRTVREDPVRKGLLYAGTEYGMYVSFNDGHNWQSLQSNLPVVPITEMQIRHGDLILSTQGRSFWVLDDLGPLRQLHGEMLGAEYHLFETRAAVIFDGNGGGPSPRGQNPPSGAVIRYMVRTESWEMDDDSKENTKEKDGEEDDTVELTLEILTQDDEVLRSFSSKKAEKRAFSPWRAFFPELGAGAKLPVKQGLNQFVWDLQLPDGASLDKGYVWGYPDGPRVPPGTYRARLTAGEWSDEVSFEVKADPRVDVSQEDLEAQYELSKKTLAGFSDTHRAVMRLRDARSQVAAWIEKLKAADASDEEIEAMADELKEKFDMVEVKFHNPKSKSGQDILNFPMSIDGQWIGLKGSIDGPLARPTDAAAQRYAGLRERLDGYLEELEAILTGDLKAFNDAVAAKELPAVVITKGTE